MWLDNSSSEKSCVKTENGYVQKNSIIKEYDNGKGIVCPLHMNIDIKIDEVYFGNLDNAYTCDAWKAEKIASVVKGEVVKI
jgi:hypothetical protein